MDGVLTPFIEWHLSKKHVNELVLSGGFTDGITVWFKKMQNAKPQSINTP